MPHIKLIGAKTSPFTRKIRIILAEKNIAFEYLPESTQGEQSPVIKHNPLGKVPVIIVDAEMEIYDSRVIEEYLEWLVPSPTLLPPEGMDRIMVKRWEALADGISDAGGIWMKERRRKELISQDVIDRQTRKFERGIEQASKMLGSSQWCHGDAYSLADIAVGSAFGWMMMRNPARVDAWKQSYPNLNAHYERLMQRPAFASTVPPTVVI